MRICIAILILTVFLQTVFLLKYRWQVKDICSQLIFINENDSNLMISREFDFGGIGELVDVLNEIIEKRKSERRNWHEKERNITDIYTSLSHDIRTPMTSLDGYFQLLWESEDEGEKKKYLSIIQERIGSLKDMLEELFVFSKLKNDEYNLELSRCNINRILKKTVFSYYENWKENGIEPRIEITDEPLYMEGNYQALRRVIQNIIKNALDHGEKQISISLQDCNGRICLEIRNQTLYPEKIDVSRVFERFYKADAARSKNSTGLGMSIAKELVLRMNGEIRAYVDGNEFCMEVCFNKSNS